MARSPSSARTWTRCRREAKTPLAIIVDVYGKKMQEDFESVLERRIHLFVNFAEGAGTPARGTSSGCG